MQTGTDRETLETAQAITDDAWTELQRTPYVQQRIGIIPRRLPDLSLSEAERRARLGQSLLQRINSLDLRCLPHDIALNLRLVRFRAQIWSREADWYWYAIDPRGVGGFGMFLPTAYCGGLLLNWVHGLFASFRFDSPDSMDHYLSLLGDYATLLTQWIDRTVDQADRGIRIPRPQIPQARALLFELKAAVRPLFANALKCRHFKPPARFRVELESQLSHRIEPVLDKALQILSEDYVSLAPETVGIGQYSGGGADVYEELVKVHTTLTLTTEEIHARGLARMEQIEEALVALRADVGYAGTEAEFLADLHADHRWRAPSVDAVKAVFQRYIDRLEPRLSEAFARRPKASYTIDPLPKVLEGSMTYGFYDPPSTVRAQGIYQFNAANLTTQPLFHIGALTYHELMPGHHMQLARQQEDFSLHPFRTHSFMNAYAEGWAEYAATLAGEMGLYENAAERYGRLVMESFLTTRLVVDTGMNALGWSLERARDYMHRHSRLTAREIATESIRYSCDIPGQALAYKLGDAHILSLRNRMQEKLGGDFDIRRFHDGVLETGAIPLTDLDWHLDYVQMHR